MNKYVSNVGKWLGLTAGAVLVVGLSAFNSKRADERRLENIVVCVEAAQQSPAYAVTACQDAVKKHSRNAYDERWAAFMRSEPEASREVLSDAAVTGILCVVGCSLIFGYKRRIENLERDVEYLKNRRIESSR